VVDGGGLVCEGNTAEDATIAISEKKDCADYVGVEERFESSIVFDIRP